MWKVRFTDSCKYTPDPEGDTNKLCGVGFLPGHHTHSARFGWRWVGNGVELSAYVYDGGKRTIVPFIVVQIGELVDLRLVAGRDYEFYVNDKLLVVARGNKKKWTYRLGLFFGGNAPAPHTMNVLITRI